ncbi:Carboxylesterase, partial [Endogone sp. FLAS-F59071]
MNRYTGSDLTPIVQTTSGPVQGYIDTAKANIHTFLGIPFAEPPVGPLRFKPPNPIEKPRQATIFATFHSKVSLQLPMPFDTLMSAELLPQSEDCLYLNVWTLGVNDGAKRPVMVWIHSGACLSGSGSQRFWNGANLAKNDVVVVTLNYRLGVLGWMHLADLCGEEFNDTANLGMLDQIAALKWVRDNIEQFGGDPKNVTLFGASVGAACALTLLHSPPAKGLFHHVIAQSPPHFMLNPREWANFKTEVFLRSLGLTPETAHELFTIDPKRLLDVQTLFLSWPNFLEALAPIGPSEDGRTIPFAPLRDMMHEDAKLFPEVEILIGWTRDEYNLFFPLMQDFGKRDREIIIRTHFTHVFGKNAEIAFGIYKDKICPSGSPAA